MTAIVEATHLTKTYGNRRRKARKQETGLLTRLGVEAKRDTAPGLLSGGEQQPTINVPIVTEGAQPAGNEILFERSLNDALNLVPGAWVTFKKAVGPKRLR